MLRIELDPPKMLDACPCCGVRSSYFAGFVVGDDGNDIADAFVIVDGGGWCSVEIVPGGATREMFFSRVHVTAAGIEIGFVDPIVHIDGTRSLTRAEALPHPMREEVAEIIAETARHPAVAERIARPERLTEAHDDETIKPTRQRTPQTLRLEKAGDPPAVPAAAPALRALHCRGQNDRGNGTRPPHAAE